MSSDDAFGIAADLGLDTTKMKETKNGRKGEGYAKIEVDSVIIVIR